MRRFRDEESGAIMLEGVFAITVILFVMIFMISFGFYLYQVSVTPIIANHIAEEIGQSYKFSAVKDASQLSEGDVSSKELLYRYFILKSSKLKGNNGKKGTTIAVSRIPQTALAKMNGTPEVTIEVVSEDIGRMHYEVTVTQKYSFLMGAILELIGRKETETFSYTAYAEGVDVLNYVDTFKLATFAINELNGVSPVIKMVNTIVGLCHTVYSFF